MTDQPGVSASRIGPAPPPRRARPAPHPVRMYDPDGIEHMVPRHIASDMRRLYGYREHPPGEEPASSGASSPAPAGDVIEPEAFADQPAEERRPLAVIDGLRSEIESLGGEFDPKHGVASLTAERDRLRAQSQLPPKESANAQ